MRVSALLNAAAFQACWWACILGAARGLPWLGPLAVLLFASMHVWLGLRPGRRRAEIRLLLAAALVGYAADSGLVLAGLLRFPGYASLGWPSTVWMVALWVALAATLNSSMSWLHGRPALAALFGAAGGPLAYLAGERLGAASLGPGPGVALAAVGVEWMIAMPALVWLAARTR